MKFKMENKKIEKNIIIIIALILGAFFIIKMMEERKSMIEPPNTEVKAIPISFNSKTLTSEVYAGRYDACENTQYNMLGLPKDRYWLTANEWRGRHLKNMPINNTKKRLLINRFKIWKQDHIKSFVERMGRTAAEECSVYPEIPPSLIIAQAIIESNYGLSKLAMEGNNLFGHKYRGKDANKFIVAADDSPTDRFTKYKSIWFSLRIHSKILMKTYYPRIKGKPTLDKWLRALCGGMTTQESIQWVDDGNTVYATSCMTEVCYAQKLKNIIRIYNLELFD